MKEFDKLIEIMTRLRSPNGCPWDNEQDHKTLKPYLIEEAYELLDAIDSDNSGKIKEELGDLLLHVVFHAQIAKDNNEFEIDDVIIGICEKLIKRHPHVFGDTEKDISTQQVLNNWESIKAESTTDDKYYVLNGVPSNMPALLKAYRIQEKVARFGFDWSNPIEIIDKLDEEKGELKEVIQSGRHDEIEDELGDLLFTIVNLCRHYGVVPESALNSTCDKFKRRFKKMEDKIRENHRKLGAVSLDELDRYWEDAKSED